MSFSFPSLDIIYPPRCSSCHAYVATQDSLCPSCWKGIRFSHPPYCSICHVPIPKNISSTALCAQCLLVKPPYAQLRFAIYYRQIGRKLITRFKYYDDTHIRKLFAKWMRYIGQEILTEADIMTVVPVHKWRLLIRRYNQVALLAENLRTATSSCYIPDLLFKKKYTKPQAHLTKTERLTNVKNAFSFNKKYTEKVTDKTILLIDDVVTTGATIYACSQILLQYQVKKIYVLALARNIA